MDDDVCKENINGKELVKLINENIKTINSSLNLCEYDIFPMFEKPDQFFNLVEKRYLMINKIMCKNFYFFWRNKFLQNNKNLLLENSLEEIDLITKCILLINPNFSSAWSKRKEIAAKNLDSELEFNRLILSKHYKCEQAIIHRRWVIRKILISKLKNYSDLVSQEIDFVLDILSPKIKSNYYCWSYLIWLIDQASQIDKNFFSTLNLINLNYRLESMLYKNPSDNCVFHFKMEYFFKYFLKLFSLDFKTILNEINLILDLILRFPYFSTSWNYGKYFLRSIKPFLSDFNTNKELLNNLLSLIGPTISILYPKHKASFEFEENSTIIDLMINISDLCCFLNEDKLNSINLYSKSFNQFIKKFC